jgi:hypothetical protein
MKSGKSTFEHLCMHEEINMLLWELTMLYYN